MEVCYVTDMLLNSSHEHHPRRLAEHGVSPPGRHDKTREVHATGNRATGTTRPVPDHVVEPRLSLTVDQLNDPQHVTMRFDGYADDRARLGVRQLIHFGREARISGGVFNQEGLAVLSHPPRYSLTEL